MVRCRNTRSRARGRRTESPESSTIPALRHGRTRSRSVRSTTRSEESPPSERSKRRRAAAKKREPREEEDVSSTASSPVREPYIPEEARKNPGTETSRALKRTFRLAEAKYCAKLVRQQKDLPTLCPHVTVNCLVTDPKLIPVRESASKTVLRAAKFVVGLSSSVDPLTRCSGFWIDWDNEKKTGIVLTTALLIRSNRPSVDVWLCKDEYASDAKITVHLRSGDAVKGKLLYCQKHYNLAFVRVENIQDVHLPSFNDGVKSGQEVFELGRDESDSLMIHNGWVEYLNPNLYERLHYMYIWDGADRYRDRECDNGGPVIDFDGKVVGMICTSTRRSFIPCSILLKCLHLWRKFERIRRPHLGLKLSAISLRDPVFVERISLKYQIDEGLIVEEVSQGSAAEECGIRVGDVIECFNGKSISTVLELENMLLSICEDGGNFLISEVTVVIQVYHTRKKHRRIKTLKLNVVEDGEVVVTASYLVTMGEVI